MSQPTKAAGGDDVEILAYGSGEAALAELKARDVDVVLSDIKMPGMSGLDVLNRVRALGLSPTFVFMTGVDDATLVIQAVRLGAVDFLVKPFSMEDMTDAVLRATRVATRERAIDALIATLPAHGAEDRHTQIENLRRQISMLRHRRESKAS